MLKLRRALKKASGSKVNKTKTVGIVANARNVNSNTTVRLTMGPERLLGVPVSKNQLRGNYWESAIEKLKKKIAPWRIRNLSYKRKIHVVKSLGISNLFYGMEVLDISKTHIKEIGNIIREFIWDDHRCILKDSICILPREMGGIGLPDLDSIRKVKRVKMIINILKTSSNELWSIIPQKSIRCLDGMYDISLFALKVDDSTDDLKNCKSLSQFYKECILSFQEMARLGRVQSQNADEIIWCNNRFKFNDKVLNYKHWSRSGIKFVSDLIKNGSINDTDIYDKLQKKAAFIFEIETIKKVFSSSMNIDTSLVKVQYQNENDLLDMLFEVPTVGIKKLSELKSSDIYKIFTLTNHIEIKSKTY